MCPWCVNGDWTGFLDGVQLGLINTDSTLLSDSLSYIIVQGCPAHGIPCLPLPDGSCGDCPAFMLLGKTTLVRWCPKIHWYVISSLCANIFGRMSNLHFTTGHSSTISFVTLRCLTNFICVVCSCLRAACTQFIRLILHLLQISRSPIWCLDVYVYGFFLPDVYGVCLPNSLRRAV